MLFSLAATVLLVSHVCASSFTAANRSERDEDDSVTIDPASVPHDIASLPVESAIVAAIRAGEEISCTSWDHVTLQDPIARQSFPPVLLEMVHLVNARKKLSNVLAYAFHDGDEIVPLMEEGTDHVSLEKYISAIEGNAKKITMFSIAAGEDEQLSLGEFLAVKLAFNYYYELKNDTAHFNEKWHELLRRLGANAHHWPPSVITSDDPFDELDKFLAFVFFMLSGGAHTGRISFEDYQKIHPRDSEAYFRTISQGEETISWDHWLSFYVGEQFINRILTKLGHHYHLSHDGLHVSYEMRL